MARERYVSHAAQKPLPRDLCEISSAYQTTQRIRHVIGVTTSMPKSFSGEFNVDGHRVVIRSGATGKKYTWAGKEYTARSAKHRIFIEMNGRLVPAGRVHQSCPYDPRKHGSGPKQRGPGGRFKSRYDR